VFSPLTVYNNKHSLVAGKKNINMVFLELTLVSKTLVRSFKKNKILKHQEK
jgi:hypothetical protein